MSLPSSPEQIGSEIRTLLDVHFAEHTDQWRAHVELLLEKLVSSRVKQERGETSYIFKFVGGNVEVGGPAYKNEKKGEDDQTAWAVVWQTDDGPSLDGPYEDEAAAMRGAWLVWVSFTGGVVGGYESGSFEEFLAVYDATDKVWVTPLGLPHGGGAAAPGGDE